MQRADTVHDCLKVPPSEYANVYKIPGRNILSGAEMYYNFRLGIKHIGSNRQSYGDKSGTIFQHDFNYAVKNFSAKFRP